ncbi:hypothetical protein CSKR_202896 [Clonorchis sinensis]|uniref:Uncharacterized protein n=1 Tax=Clonorchis sinensis TaxID=79923 RepID=A0A8T1M3G6_CLOSI|nr:hypothetical protein CSKR_202896 [Clonorchis sinensis]
MILTSVLQSFFCVYVMLQMCSANASTEDTGVINGTKGGSAVTEKVTTVTETIKDKSTSLTTPEVSNTMKNDPTTKSVSTGVSAGSSTKDTTTKEARGKAVEDTVDPKSSAGDSGMTATPTKAPSETASVNNTEDLSMAEGSEPTTNTGVRINGIYGYELLSGLGIVLLTSILLRRLPTT